MCMLLILVVRVTSGCERLLWGLQRLLCTCSIPPEFSATPPTLDRYDLMAARPPRTLERQFHPAAGFGPTKLLGIPSVNEQVSFGSMERTWTQAGDSENIGPSPFWLPLSAKTRGRLRAQMSKSMPPRVSISVPEIVRKMSWSSLGELCSTPTSVRPLFSEFLSQPRNIQTETWARTTG